MESISPVQEGPSPRQRRWWLWFNCKFSIAQTSLLVSEETAHCKSWFLLRANGSLTGMDALFKDWPSGLLNAFPLLPLIPHVPHRSQATGPVDSFHVAKEALVPCSPPLDPLPAVVPASQGRSPPGRQSCFAPSLANPHPVASQPLPQRLDIGL